MATPPRFYAGNSGWRSGRISAAMMPTALPWSGTEMRSCRAFRSASYLTRY